MTQQSIVPSALTIKAQLHEYQNSLGDSRYRQLVVRKSYLAGGALYPSYADYFLYPRCNISNVPTNMLSLLNSDGTVVLSINDLYIKNMPRIYSREFLKDDTQFYIVDPVVNNQGQITGGIRCKLIDVLDNKMLSWRIFLSQNNDPIPLTPNSQTFKLNSAALSLRAEMNSIDQNSQLWEAG